MLKLLHSKSRKQLLIHLPAITHSLIKYFQLKAALEISQQSQKLEIDPCINREKKKKRKRKKEQ